MMNAELVARDEERIIIPTAYRTDYLGVLKAFSHNAHTDPLIRMLDVAQAYTHRIDWSKLDQARALLAATNASAERSDAKLKLTRSEARCVGQEGVSKCRSMWSPSH